PPAAGGRRRPGLSGREIGQDRSVDISQTLVSTTSIVAVLFYGAILFDGGRAASRHIRAGEPRWAWGATLLAVGIILANEVVTRWERWHSIFGWPPLFAPRSEERRVGKERSALRSATASEQKSAG